MLQVSSLLMSESFLRCNLFVHDLKDPDDGLINYFQKPSLLEKIRPEHKYSNILLLNTSSGWIVYTNLHRSGFVGSV